MGGASIMVQHAGLSVVRYGKLPPHYSGSLILHLISSETRVNGIALIHGYDILLVPNVNSRSIIFL